MTMRTKYLLKCACGHVGTIHMSENDQPYSKEWKQYRLEGLNGSGFIVNGTENSEQLFAGVNLSCPECGLALTTPNCM